MATSKAARGKAEANAAKSGTPAAEPTGASIPVVVQAQPVAAAQPDEANQKRVEFMQNFDRINEFNEMAQSLATRVMDSGVGYYDDNGANKRYIAKIDENATTAPTGTPLVSLQKKPFPPDNQLPGTLVYRQDGTFYSIPPHVRSLGDVVDPETNERLIGDLDPKRHKARLEAAGLADVVILKADGTVEAKEEKSKK